MIRKILKWTGIILGSFLLLIFISYGFIAHAVSNRMDKRYAFAQESIVISRDSVTIEQGHHLVQINGCTDCHGANLAGRTMIDETMLGRLSASNLTKGSGGLPANYNAEDWLRSLRHGIDRHGRPLLLMPSHDFTKLSENDLAAIIAYGTQLPPVENHLPSNKIGPVVNVMAWLGKMPLLPVEKIKHDEPLKHVQDTAEGIAFGKYLTITCSGCHKPNMKGGDPVVPGQPPVADISSTGHIGKWTKEQFFTTLRTGVTPSGHQLQPDQMPWKMTAKCTDKELASIYAYLRSLQ